MNHVENMWSFLVYTVAKTEQPSSPTDPTKNKTAALKLNLTESLLYRGYTLWIDKYFNSPNVWVTCM